MSGTFCIIEQLPLQVSKAFWASFGAECNCQSASDRSRLPTCQRLDGDWPTLPNARPGDELKPIAAGSGRYGMTRLWQNPSHSVPLTCPVLWTTVGLGRDLCSQHSPGAGMG